MNFIPFVIIGAVLVAGLFAFGLWLRSRDVRLTWYEWLMGVIGLLLFLVATQHFFGAMSENFPYAAWMGLLVLGLPALILLAIAWWLPWRRHRAAG